MRRLDSENPINHERIFMACRCFAAKHVKSIYSHYKRFNMKIYGFYRKILPYEFDVSDFSCEFLVSLTMTGLFIMVMNAKREDISNERLCIHP